MKRLMVLLFGILCLNVYGADISLMTDAEEKAADPVMGTAAGWTVRLDIDGYFPDEGVLVSTTSPDFWKQGPGAFITKPPYLNGKERQKYHRVYIRPTGENWTEQMVTIVPDADGKLTLTCYAVAPGAMNIVHWDDVRVEGATLENGGFEKADAEGTPKGWKLGGWTTEAPKARYITGADDAAEGEDYVMSSWTWHWSATVTDVKKDQPIVLRWKNRFVAPETRYPVRVGISGLDAAPTHAHTTFKVPGWRDLDPASPARYIGRLLSGQPAKVTKDWGTDSKAVQKSLAIYLAKANSDWSERIIRIEPEKDGGIELTFHGARIRNLEKGVYDPVFIDYRILDVQGATLANADIGVNRKILTHPSDICPFA